MPKQTAHKKTERLVLLDAHAIIHRAYHALPDFSSSKGEPTGALYGLTTMLMRIADELKPDHIAACFDRPEPTHRHEVYEAYKATRPKAEDALVEQLKHAREVFKAFGIPVLEAPGFEADDILGTIVKKLAKRAGLEIVIASGDLDTLQLVGPHVRVYTLRKGLSDTVTYDEEAVRARFGFGPEAIPDFKGLSGDPSDNIKGVSGIGEKTASELVKQFGSIENIYRTLHADPEVFTRRSFKPRVVKLLTEGKKDAEFSKMLATIRTDAPVPFELAGKHWRMEDHAESILSLCDELDFRSIKERLHARFRTGSKAEAAETAQDKGGDVDANALKETAVALWLLHSDMTNPGLDDVLHYAKTNDFDAARKTIFAELKKTGQLAEVYEKIEKPLIPVVLRMNAAGIFLDVPHLNELAKEYEKELAKIAGRIFKAAGHEFNVNSPRQLGAVLFDELKLSLPRQKKTAGGARTTREDELAKMADLHPVVGDVLAYRELHKLLSTYVLKMPGMVAEDGRLHAQFLQAGTTTGRMASESPNLQNIPVKSDYGRRVREAFAARRGFVLAALDYSQIELRVAAGISGDKKLLGIFKEGGDIHASVASQVFNVPPERVDYEMRRRAKVINFGILYGMGVNALKENLDGGVTRDEAAAFLDAYFKKFTGLALWIERTKLDAARRGFTETLFGRRRYFAGFKSPLPYVRAQAERMAVNAPLQGTQADIIKLAMVRADELIEKEGWREKAQLVLQVHDELVYEIESKEAERIARELRDVMETAVPHGALHGVPIIADVSIGKHWGDMRRLSRT